MDLILQEGFKRANRSVGLAADDAVKKAWNKAWQDFDPARGEFEHFFASILTSKLSAADRSEERHQSRLVPITDDVDFPDEAAETAMDETITRMDRSSKGTLRNAVARALRQLDKRDRKIFWLRFWKDLSYEEMAQRPEYREERLSVSAFKSRVHRACVILRRLLHEFSPFNRRSGGR